MKIIALEKELPGTTSEQFAPYLKAEADRVWQLYQIGFLREFYFRQDQSTAVLVLECQDLQEARKMLAEMPLVQNGLIDFELIPLKPYPGFARLFFSAL
jgi:hypothetical protein